MTTTAPDIDPRALAPDAACDEFEVAVDMRTHGALPAVDASLLDAHLRGCASCRAYAQATASVDASLAAASQAAPPSWERIERQVMRAQRRSSPWVLLSPVLAVSGFYGLARLLGATGPLLPWLVTTAFALVMSGAMVGADRARRRRVQALLDQVDVVTTYRRELQTTLRVWRVGRVLAVAWLVVALFAVDGLDHAAIAEILGVSTGTVWSRLHRARKALATASPDA